MLAKRRYTGKDLLSDRFGRVFEIPLELSQSGHQITGVALDYYGGSELHVQEPLKGAGRLEWFGHGIGRFPPAGLGSYFRKTLAVARNFQPDVVVGCSDALHVIWAWRVARSLGVPLVADLYDNFEAFGLTRTPGIHLLFRRALRDADGIACVSEPLCGRVRQTVAREGNVAVVANGIPDGWSCASPKESCRAEFGLPQGVNLVGTAGALHGSRGIEVLFQAFEKLSQTEPKLHLALAGPVGRGVRIPQGGRIHYRGNLDSALVPCFMSALDVGVICNRDSEFGRYCFPQKLYEFLACGVPVVSADVGAIGDLLQEYPQCLFDVGEPRHLAHRIQAQRVSPMRPDIPIPTWGDQAKKMEALLEAVVSTG